MWNADGILAEEEREHRLPLWAQQKINAGRALIMDRNHLRTQVEQRDEQIDELRRQLAQGISKPGSDTWIMPEDAEDFETQIGLGYGEPVAFGKSFEDPLFTVFLRDGGLVVELAGSPVIHPNSGRYGSGLRIELS